MTKYKPTRLLLSCRRAPQCNSSGMFAVQCYFWRLVATIPLVQRLLAVNAVDLAVMIFWLCRCGRPVGSWFDLFSVVCVRLLCKYSAVLHSPKTEQKDDCSGKLCGGHCLVELVFGPVIRLLTCPPQACWGGWMLQTRPLVDRCHSYLYFPSKTQ